MTVSIRTMDEAHIPVVQNIAQISWNTTYDGIIPLNVQNSFLQSAYSDESMRNRLENPYMYVAEVAEEIVGFANFSDVEADGTVELAAIYLYPQFRGKGIGTALLQHAIKQIDGIKVIYINVEKDNTVGTNFYKAKGFETVAEFDEDFDGHILKTVRMALKV